MQKIKNEKHVRGAKREVEKDEGRERREKIKGERDRKPERKL